MKSLVIGEPRYPYPKQFVPGGDPGLVRLTSTQKPAFPYPEGNDRRSFETWRSVVLKELSTRTGLVTETTSRGALPERDLPVGHKILGTEEVDDVRRTLLEYESFDGTKIPAYVCELLKHERTVGVVLVSGHGAGIMATAGFVSGDYQHEAAMSLARAGFLVITPELRGFGLLGSRIGFEHNLVAQNALVAGSSYPAVLVRDLQYALSVLEHWPGVDPGRLAAAGTSLGGEMAVLLSAIDSRVKVTISCSYGGSVGPVQGVSDTTQGKVQKVLHACHLIPGINLVLRKEDRFRLLAPRPLLVIRGKEDLPETAERFAVLLRNTYAQLGASDRFRFETREGGHEFFTQPAIDFLKSWL